LSRSFAGMNTRPWSRASGSTNRFLTQPWPMLPGFDAARIRSGTSLSGPESGRRSREKRYVYGSSGNWVSSSKPMNWNSAPWYW
jgi:hypothetical protein